MAENDAKRRISLWTRVKQIQLFDARGLDDTTQRSLLMIVYAALLGQVCGFITTGPAWNGYLRDVLKTNDLMLGIMTALPVATNTLQILVAHWMQRFQKRRFFMLFFGILGRFFWIPVALIPYMIPGSMQSVQMAAVMVCVVAVAVGNSFVQLAYSSLVADIVPIRIRGRYFASRLAVSLITGLVGGLGAAVLVDKLGLAGYTIALTIAGLTGMADIACFFRVQFPPMGNATPGEQQSFLVSLREVFADKGFMRLVLYFTCWAFAVNISGPFFTPHMIDNLGMSYTQITLMNQIFSNFVTMLFLAQWGSPLDRFGNKAILQFCARICMVTPILWVLVTPNSLWLILVLNFMSGFFYPPIDLAQQNFYLGASSTRNRGMYVAVFFAIFNLCGVALSNALGGWLIQTCFTPLAANWTVAKQLGWGKYQFIFIVSGVLRVAVALALFPRLREDGESSMRTAFVTLWKEGRLQWKRWFQQVKATRLRKRYRKQNPQLDEPNDVE